MMHCSAIPCALVVVLSACNPFACVYTTRFVGTSGSAAVAAGTLAVEYVNMREYSEGGLSTSINWRVTGEALASPPKTLSLRDANATGDVVIALSMSHTSAVSMVSASAHDVAVPDRNRMFALLESGRGRVFLELENGTTIIATLTVSAVEGWHRPMCD